MLGIGGAAPVTRHKKFSAAGKSLPENFICPPDLIPDWGKRRVAGD
jgi:hypothetical protein